jgi:hypothetical protein
MKNSYLNIILIFIIAILLFFSCQRGNQNFTIIPNPIYSEVDTFRSSMNYLQHNKTDYYVVEGGMNNKTVVISSINLFVKKVAPKMSKHYDNYAILFYYETPDVNEIELKKYLPDQKYEMFSLHRNDLIVSYSFYNSMLIDIDSVASN